MLLKKLVYYDAPNAFPSCIKSKPVLISSSVSRCGLGLISPEQGWRVEAYVNNLFEKDYLLDLGNTGKSFGLPTAIRGEPRIVGIRFNHDF